MSKLKGAQFAKERNKSRIAIPYCVDTFRNSNNFENNQFEPNIDLPPVGAYVTPPEHHDAVIKKAEKSVNEEQTFEIESHQKNFCTAIKELWKQGKMCDVILSVDKSVFRVHKIALAACSDHFRELFVSREKSPTALDTSRIPLLGIKSEVVKQIIEAVYSAKITLSQTTVGDVLSAAAYLRMPLIVEACQKYLTQRLNVENCLKILQIAHMYDLENLKEGAYEIACVNFKFISRHKEFSKLRYYELLSMLPRQDLVVDSEIQVFNAVIRWTEADRSIRFPYLGRLMRHVRFPLMTENQLVDQVEGSSYVVDAPEVGELVREAVRYHLLPYRRSILQTQRTVPRTTLNLDVIVASGGLPDKKEGRSSGSIYYYVPDEDTWSLLTIMPEPRHHHAAAVLGGFLYIAGGDHGQGLSDSSDKVWRYDSWTEEWLQVTSMLKPRQSFQLGVLDSRLYAVGGRAGKDETLAQVERYNPSTNTWSVVDQISSARRHVAVATLSGRLYAVGGSGSDLISRRVERFNPVSSQWERRHPICKPRFSASLHAVKNRLWLVGGATVNDKDPAKGIIGTSEIEVYSPAMDQWMIVGSWDSRPPKEIPMSEQPSEPFEEKIGFIRKCRTEAGSCILNDNVYLIAGYSWSDKDRLNDVERLDISSISPKFTKHSKSNILHEMDAEHDSTIKANSGMLSTPSSKQLSNYPIHCTGIACAALTLHKRPSCSRSSLPSISLQITGPETKFENSTRERIAPRLDFGEAPKTAAGRFYHADENRSTPLVNSHLEKSIETLRSIGFPSNVTRPAWAPRRAATASRTTTSRHSHNERDGIGSASPLEFFNEDDLILEQSSPDPVVEEDEIDVAIGKVISLTLDMHWFSEFEPDMTSFIWCDKNSKTTVARDVRIDNWDETSDRQSNSPAQYQETLTTPSNKNRSNVFMTE